MDIDNAFLNAPLKEEVYLQLPGGLGGCSQGLVLRLRKALYGLKQAQRTWEKELGQFLEAYRFRRCQSDSALYIRTSKTGDQVYIPVYVDDLMLVADNKKGLDDVKMDLKAGYKLKDLGEISMYLGMQVTRDKATRTISLGLPKYISELEKKYKRHLDEQGSHRGCGSPMVPDVMKRVKAEDWSEEEAKEVNRKDFMSILGSLMFASLTCRPDLAFTVSLLSQAGVDPRWVHMDALVRALRYLINTKDAQLVYQGQMGSTQPCVFTDSDWGSEKDGLSRAAWLTKVAGGVVTWYSKKLPLVATSSTEAEYKALSEGAKEAMWFNNLLGELGLHTHKITIYCDNQAAMQVSKNPVQHHKTRHFKLSWHYVRQLQEAGEISVEFVRTALQDADVLTKALSVTLHRSSVERLGLNLNS